MGTPTDAAGQDIVITMYPAGAESVLWLSDPATELHYKRIGLSPEIVERIQRWEYAHYDLAEAGEDDLAADERRAELRRLDEQGEVIARELVGLFGPGVVIRLRTQLGDGEEVELRGTGKPSDEAVARRLRHTVDKRRGEWSAMMAKLRQRVDGDQ